MIDISNLPISKYAFLRQSVTLRSRLQVTHQNVQNVAKTFDYLDSFAYFFANDILSDNNVKRMLPVIENHSLWLLEMLKKFRSACYFCQSCNMINREI